MLRAFTLAPFEPLDTASFVAISFEMFVLPHSLLALEEVCSAPYAVVSSSARRRSGLLCCYFLFIPITAKGSLPTVPF